MYSSVPYLPCRSTVFFLSKILIVLSLCSAIATTTTPKMKILIQPLPRRIILHATHATLLGLP